MQVPNFVYYSIIVKAGCWARVYLNDLPLHEQSAPGEDSHSSSVNHMLIHGENTLSVHVLAAPEEREEGAVRVLFYHVLDPKSRPMKIEPVHSFSFPEALSSTPELGRRVPYYHESRFVANVNGFVPAWVSADPEEPVDCRGTPELRDAVNELYECVTKLDAERFIDLCALRLEEYERAHPGVTLARADTRRDALRELFRYKPRMDSLDMGSLHFESRAGGRVVHVSRDGGGYVLYAPAEKDPRRRLKANLLFTRHQGALRIWG